MPKRKLFDTKQCLNCGTELSRKWFPKSGHLECPVRYSKRAYCSRKCAANSDVLPIGTEALRKDRDRVARYWIKVGEKKWKRRAIVVWEAANGAIPRGYIVHHRDRNPLNDAIENLQLLTRPEHAKEHHDDIWKGRWPISSY